MLKRLLTTQSAMAAVVVSTPRSCPVVKEGDAKPAHHVPKGKGFTNPWPSFKARLASVSCAGGLY
jgi:hypothetical protein